MMYLSQDLSYKRANMYWMNLKMILPLKMVIDHYISIKTKNPSEIVKSSEGFVHFYILFLAISKHPEQA